MAAPASPPPGAARLAFFTPVREYPPLADRKASVLLAANGLMVTVLLTFSGAIEVDRHRARIAGLGLPDGGDPGPARRS